MFGPFSNKSNYWTMSKDPAFLFYSQDFYSGTRTMTPEERACYIDLLIYQHQNGYIPNDLKRMSMFCSGVEQGTLEGTLQTKFKLCDKGWYNERLQQVVADRAKFKAGLSNKGKLGSLFKLAKRELSGDKYNKIKHLVYSVIGESKVVEQLNDPNQTLQGTLQGLLKHLENEIENEIVIENTNEEESEIKIEVWPTFDDFWNLYDKKTDRAKCEKKWNNLKQEDKEAIMEYLPAYKQSTPDKKYRRNPETFLNNKTWENEIIDNSTGNNRNRIPQAGSFTLADFGYDENTFS